MSILISCQSLEKSFSSRNLFRGLTFGVEEGARMGIIGSNGSGKSTLLRILAGVDDPDGGTVVRKRFLKLAYVDQETRFDDAKTVRETLMEIAASAEVAASDIELEIDRTLSKVGFTKSDQRVTELSGGWRKRLAIAGALAQSPDVLLLDEPTNHLDIESVLWLEELLKGAPFAWVMVSHDRYFLENTVTEIAELSPIYENGLLLSKGRYSDFLQQRTDYLQGQRSYAEALANKVRREVEWLRRGPKARTTKAKYRIDEAQNLQEELGQVTNRLRTNTVDIDFSGSGRQTKKLIEAENISVSRGERKLVTSLSIVLSPGARLGLLGANGTGKSTLIKALIKELDPDDGTVKHAENLKWVYFDQGRKSLNLNERLKSALAEKGDAVVYRDRSIHVMSWAKKFQFRQEQLDVPVGELSGGEQARVAIARLMVQSADVLVLDEPTNDLDIATLEILEESLVDFPGAVLLVSHDRYLMERVCNIFVGLDGNGGSRLYADYFQWQSSIAEKPLTKEKGQAPAEDKPKTTASSKRLSYMEQREFDQMESAIVSAEGELAAAQSVLDDPGIATQSARLLEATKSLQNAQEKVERLYARWADLESKIK
ncbi:MAG: ABC-F family ATP-binding cassette domain-containing protein [Oligoflexales bacterium]